VETAFEGMILGAFDYLVKPCEMEVLEQRIRRAQEKKGIEEDEGED
jgi:DNA-binding NtrC family response regulator